MNKILWLRKKLNLTMTEFGKMLGISAAHVHYCENNKRRLSIELGYKIVKLAKSKGIELTLEDVLMP